MSEEAQNISKILALRVQVSGRVQGVFFRASARKEADDLGVMGWVQNCRDGRVEAHFQGAPANVEAMVRWCHKGSPAAHVTDVVTQACAPEDVLDFSIRD
jgi:acylphosphatase